MLMFSFDFIKDRRFEVLTDVRIPMLVFGLKYHVDLQVDTAFLRNMQSAFLP
jgi:hypothetical protein